MTFEIKPKLRLIPSALFMGPPGTDVDVAVGFVGPTAVPPTAATPGRSYDPVPVRLQGPGALGLVPSTATTGPDGMAHFKVRAVSGVSDWIASTPGVDAVALRVLGGTFAQSQIRVDLLQPGDVLLHVGAGYQADAISVGEWFQLGANPNGGPTYSHAGIYVGNGETVEMVGGWLRQPLLVSFPGDHAVDVYRRPGLSAPQRQALADKAISYGAGGGPPYAQGQIAVLGASLAFSALQEQSFADTVDLSDLGREAMICSELVAWAYYDCGVPLRVRPWRAVVSAGVLAMPTQQWSTERWMDYTTPNMLAQSADLAFQFRAWPPRPMPLEVKPSNGACPGGYVSCGTICRVGQRCS